MADDKKGGGSSPFHKDFHKEVLYFVLPGLLVLALLIQRFLAYLNSLDLTGTATLWQRFLMWLGDAWAVYKVGSTILTGAAIVWAVYSYFKLHEIEKEEKKIYGPGPEKVPLMEEEKPKKKQDDWHRVLSHAHSENPAEWRVAIIEADIMLDDMLTALGYLGEGVAEKLKSVDSSDMLTLDAAWEAHKVRNRIAHSGSDFELNEREAKRVIMLFESVFREFGMI
jgi:hypothetical protein